MEENQKRKDISPLLRSVFWLIVIWGFFLFGLLVASSYFLPWYEWLKLKSIQRSEFAGTFPLLILYIYISLFLTVPLNYYRVIKKYHVERYISTIHRGLEFLVLFILIINHQGVFVVALGYLLLRFCYLMFIIIDLHKRSDTFYLLPVEIHLDQVKKVFKPGVSSLFYYLGGNILNQGLSTVVGLNFGPAKLVMYSTVRTLINLTKQLFSIINLSIYSEFSYAFGSKNFDVLKKLVRTSLAANVIISGGSCVVLLLTGRFIINWWTHGVVNADPLFFNTYLLYAFLGSISSVSINVIFATNTYKRSGIVYLGAISICVLLNAIFIKSLGLTFAPFTLICFEIAFILISFKIVFQLLDSGWKDLWQSFSIHEMMPSTIKKIYHEKD